MWSAKGGGLLLVWSVEIGFVAGPGVSSDEPHQLITFQSSAFLCAHMLTDGMPAWSDEGR